MARGPVRTLPGRKDSPHDESLSAQLQHIPAPKNLPAPSRSGVFDSTLLADGNDPFLLGEKNRVG
ncbi:hypothetical protein D3C85_1818380 [compost metagenome]